MATSPADFLMDGVLSAETDGEAPPAACHNAPGAVGVLPPGLCSCPKFCVSVWFSC